MFEFFKSSVLNKINPERLKNSSVNVVSFKHLEEGVKPLRASICDSRDVDQQTQKTIDEITENGDFVNYYESPRRLQSENMISPEHFTYVISECNDNDKYSMSYYNCTGVVAVGTDIITGDQISILSHQDPSKFLLKKKKEFEEDLALRIRQLVGRSKPGTVDAVFFGGNSKKGKREEEYKNSIKALHDICVKELHFEPAVLTGPNLNINTETEMYLDTQKRQLYLIRPLKQNTETNETFFPSDVDTNAKNWNLKK